MATSLQLQGHQHQQPLPNRRITCRNPQWTYLKLELITHPILLKTQEPLDPLTARAYLTSALSQFLGLMGTAISLDILKIEQVPTSSSSSSTSSTTTTTTQTTKRQFLWLRAPRDDAAGVVAALSSWVGSTSSTAEGGVAWRVCAKGNYLAAVMHGSGGDVFD